VSGAALEELAQSRMLDVDEITEHVHVAARLHRGDLDAGDRLDATRAGGTGHVAAGVDGVVIGHGDHRHAVRRGDLDQFRWCERPSDAVV
jgi:hypothetical protein